MCDDWKVVIHIKDLHCKTKKEKILISLGKVVNNSSGSSDCSILFLDSSAVKMGSHPRSR